MGERPLILNANDHDQTRYLVTKILEPRGYRVIEASNGEEALRALSLRPLLVVLDVKLGDISGLEVCRMIKSSPETGSTLVLLTSATYVTADRRVQGLDCGADGYLVAPYEPAELAATVNSLMRLGAADRKLREAAEELRDADRKKDEFLAMLAHELRNPLAAIQSALPLLQAYREAPERHERMRRMVSRQVAHLAHMVDDLLEVSRITQGRIELERRALNLGDVVEQAVHAVRPTVDARNQRLEVSVSDPKLFVDGDATRLEQVLVNLLDNASKYTEPSGGIWVNVDAEPAPEGREAVIRVRDDGMGITPEVLPHVFELFAQGEQNLARTRGGMGIGLTLAKRLTELHGGKIAAQSAGAGRGAEFEVRLPLTRAHDPRPAPIPAYDDLRPATTGRKILLVEDNPDARQALAELLELMGHDVLAAEDGPEGVDAAARSKPQVILVDIGLPGLNGYEVARRIREHEAPSGTKAFLVALTGYGGTEQRARALEAGFDEHIVKPVDVGVLSRLVDGH